MPERREEVTAAGESEQIDQNEIGTMSLHYPSNMASMSRSQPSQRPLDEPMDLADTLSYADNHPNWTQVWDPRMSTSFTTTKGLLNGPGENNCFLNSAVQVLWHLDVFRRNFRQLSGHLCMGNSCIFCALKVIFTQFQYSDRSTLPPDALRKALASTFADQQKFQIGLMDDAAECFENILVRIHFHIANSEPEDMCGAKHCIPHQKFAMNVVEQIVCSSCGATSEPLPFNQMVYYVSASALVRQAKFLHGRGGFPQDQFGQVLRSAVSQGDYRDCPSLCGEKVAIRRNLINLPDVVSVGIVWDSDQPITGHIHDVMTSIGITLRLTDLFHSVVDERQAQATILQLVGVVCYYGKHYSTFFFHSKMKKWISFDDATVREVGTEWSSVVDKCCRGHYQPLLLLYAIPNDSSISLESAPRTTVMVDSEYCFNKNNSGISTKGNHVRQRSADRDANDILPGGRKVQTYAPLVRDSKSCHAITPTPQNHCSAPTRRSTTPSTELGRDGKPAIVHFRQSSYLFAVDGKENYVSCTCNGDAVTPSAGSEEYCDYDCVDGPSHKYPVQTGGRYQNGINLLGSLPPEGVPVNGCYKTQVVASTQGGFHNQMAVNEAIHSRVAEFVQTPSPVPNGCNGQMTGSMQPALNQCLYPTKTHCPGYRAQVTPNRQQPLHRSGSLEDIDLPPGGATYTKAGQIAQQSRPQSARPFDYRNNAKPTTKRPTNYAPRCVNGNAEMRPMKKMAAWMMSSDEAGDEVYINSKAVQSILNYQGVQQQMHPATRLAAQQGGRSASPLCTTWASGTTGAVMASRSTQLEPKMTRPSSSHYHRGDSVDKTSQCSTDSSGDRNSASSAGNGSIPLSQDSVDSYKARYDQRQGTTSRHGASTENTRTSTNPSAAATSKHRLVNIPETSAEARQQGSRQMSETEKMETGLTERFEQLCMHAEGLMDSSNRKERERDLPQALLHCNRAIGCIQQALALNGVGQDSKLHARVKCNTCVMRSRSLHRKMTTRQDNNDPSSLSPVETDAKLPGGVTSTSTGVVHSRQPSATSVHVPQPSATSVYTSQSSVGSAHIRQPSAATVYSRVESLYSEKTPKDAESELQECINRLSAKERQLGEKTESVQQQCINQLSINGRQSGQKTVAVPHGILKKPKQKAPKPKPPVRTSSIEQKKTTMTSQIPVLSSQQKVQTVLPQSGRQQQLGQFESATSCIEAYATLPRKPGQRASRQVAAPALNAEVYESYLQRQRTAASCMLGAEGTVAASGGVMRRPVTTAQGTNDEEVNHAGSRPGPASACSYRGPEESTHPSIMEQLIHEGLIAPRTPVMDPMPQNQTPNTLHLPRDSDIARDSDRQVRLTTAQCGRMEQSVQQQGRHVGAVTGRQTPHLQGAQVTHPAVEGRRSQRQKQWVVTEALYYGMPTKPVLQQRSSTPMSSQQGETTEGGYWGAFPPKNDLRKSSSQGYLTSSRRGQQSDTSCSTFEPDALLQRLQSTATETTGASRTQSSEEPNVHCAGSQTTPIASWDRECRSATTQVPGGCDQRQSCLHDKCSEEQTPCNMKKCTREENVNLMLDSTGIEYVTQRGVTQCCHRDDDTRMPCNGCIADDSNVSWSNQGSEVGSLNFNVNSQGSSSMQDYGFECGHAEPGLIDENTQCSDLVCGHAEPENIHSESPESLPKPGLKPAIKSEETLLKTKNQRRRPRRRVTFSENIALISLADNEDERETVDYMAYVASTLAMRQQQGSADVCTVVPPSVDPQAVLAGVRTGSSDDAKTESMDRNISDKVQCMLCRKRLVDMTEVYCPDCRLYMSRFRPLISQC